MAVNGTIKMPEIATPDTPASGYQRLYFGTDDSLKKIKDTGLVETVLTDATGQPLDATLTSLAALTASNLSTKVFGITLDGGGSAITTGVKGYVVVPYSGTITQWTLIADQSGSIVIDVWKDTYANYPPTVADTIAGSEKPTLSTATKNQDTNLTTWTTTVTAGDIIGFNVDSASTVTRVHLTIQMTVS